MSIEIRVFLFIFSFVLLLHFVYLVVSVLGCFGVWAFSFAKDLVLKEEFGFYVVMASLKHMVRLF